MWRRRNITIQNILACVRGVPRILTHLHNRQGYSRHWHFAMAWYRSESFLSQIITGNDNLIHHPNPNSCRNQREGSIRSPQRKRNRRGRLEQKEWRLWSCGMGKALLFWTSCLGGQQWTMITVFKILKCLNVRLCRVRSTRKTSEVLLLQDNATS